MLKPSLQLKLGQQLTMTPQLQQAIRLLQLPALELQAHIRELLETNVMLEPDEAEASGTFEVAVTAAEQPKPPARARWPSASSCNCGNWTRPPPASAPRCRSRARTSSWWRSAS